MKISIRGFTMSLLLLLLSMSGGAQQDAPSSPKRNHPIKLWLSRSGSILLAESSTFEKDNQIQIWDTAQQKPVGDLPLSKGLNGNVLAISDDGRQVIVRRAIYEAYFMQYNEYYFLAHPGTHPDPNDDLVTCECWGLGLGGTNAKLMWSITSQRSENMAAAFQGTNVVLLRSIFTPSRALQKYVMPNVWNTRIETRDTKGKLLRTVALQTRKGLENYRPLTLSPDGRLIALSNESQLLISDIRNGRAVLPAMPRSELGSSLVLANIEFSPDGRTLMDTTEEIADTFLSEDGGAHVITVICPR